MRVQNPISRTNGDSGGLNKDKGSSSDTPRHNTQSSEEINIGLSEVGEEQEQVEDEDDGNTNLEDGEGDIIPEVVDGFNIFPDKPEETEEEYLQRQKEGKDSAELLIDSMLTSSSGHGHERGIIEGVENDAMTGSRRVKGKGKLRSKKTYPFPPIPVNGDADADNVVKLS